MVTLMPWRTNRAIGNLRVAAGVGSQTSNIDMVRLAGRRVWCRCYGRFAMTLRGERRLATSERVTLIWHSVALVQAE